MNEFPLPGHQQVACEPTAVYPAAAVVEPYVSPGRMVWVATADGAFAAVPRDSLPLDFFAAQPAPVRDLTPQPLIDPRAQLVVAGGVGAGAAGAGIGWGVGQAVAGIAAVSGSSALIVAALLLAAAKLTGGGTSTTNVHNETHISNHNRWWGRSTTTTNH